MKKNKRKNESSDPDMLPEYDFTGAVRGKYYGKLTRDSKIIVIGKPAATKRRAAQSAKLLRNGKKRRHA
ncbi:MAG: hypothetical protein HYX28_05710 [Candidatus Koribacter versatilis]|uniref:Uncharacterized protein n=1 Tax=Candidatus Korobacter versatilis TaxID=658062 RepID=A0A932A813_9BACT|nr:hypothetical protein [Candidatus Koribacter versatilis]